MAEVPVNRLAGLPWLGRPDGRLPGSIFRTREAIRGAGLRMIERPVRGGSTFFVRLADLPPETRAALVAAEHGAEPAPESVGDWDRYAHATPWQRTEIERRAGALDRVDELLAAGMRLGEARGRVAAEQGVTAETLRNWHNRVRGCPRAEWAMRLMPKHPRTGRKAAMDEGLYKDSLGFKRDHPGLAWKQVWQRTKQLAVAEGKDWPSYDTFLARWREEHPQTRAFIERGPKAQADLIPPRKRDRSDIGALEIVSIDARLVDVFVNREDGSKPRRIWVLAMVDVGSNKTLALHVAEEESEDAYCKLIYKAVDRYGWFDEIEVDNTKAAKALGLERMLKSFGVRVHRVTPYCGRAKIVERKFKEHAQKIDPTFGFAYCGRSPKDRPERFDPAAAPPLTEFIARYEAADAQLDAEHRGVFNHKKDGKTADERFAEKMAKRVRRVMTERERTIMACKAFRVTPNKRGELEILYNTFWSSESQAALERFKGRKVWAYVDPDDIQRGTHVQDDEGNIIIDHVPVWLSNGYRDVEAARKGEQAKKRERKSIKELELASAEYIRNRYPSLTQAAPQSAPSDGTVITPAGGFPNRQKAEREPGVPAEFDQKAFRAGLNIWTEQLKRDRGIVEFGPLVERGGAATPPAQSATRAEARITKAKSA